MLRVGISYSFEKKKRLLIVDYIKPSPVYQVKCKLVYSVTNNAHLDIRVHLRIGNFIVLKI